MSWSEKFPAKSSVPRILSEFVKTKWMLRNKTDNDILNLPDMCEPDKIDAMSILNIISTSIFSGRRDMFPFVSFRMVQLTVSTRKSLSKTTFRVKLSCFYVTSHICIAVLYTIDAVWKVRGISVWIPIVCCVP